METPRPPRLDEFPKWARARALVALILFVNTAIIGLFFGPERGNLGLPHEVQLFCLVPSIVALVALLRRDGLDGVEVAQWVGWTFASVIAIVLVLVTLFSLGASSSDRNAAVFPLVGLIALQLMIPAAVKWARTDAPLLRAIGSHLALFFAALVLITLAYFST